VESNGDAQRYLFLPFAGGFLRADKKIGTDKIKSRSRMMNPIFLYTCSLKNK